MKTNFGELTEDIFGNKVFPIQAGRNKALFIGNIAVIKWAENQLSEISIELKEIDNDLKKYGC